MFFRMCSAKGPSKALGSNLLFSQVVIVREEGCIDDKFADKEIKLCASRRKPERLMQAFCFIQTREETTYLHFHVYQLTLIELSALATGQQGVETNSYLPENMVL